MASSDTDRLRFPLAETRCDVYPPLDDADMDSDLASDDGRSSTSLAGSTYEIVSNHPDQDLDHAEESDFTAPDDTHSIDDESEASAFEVPNPPHITPHPYNELETAVPMSPHFNDTLSTIKGSADLGDSAMTSSTVVLPPATSAVQAKPTYQFPSAPVNTSTEIKIPQASQRLKLGRSLRIAYHGPDSFKNEILDKVAQAVAFSVDVDNSTEIREDGYDHYQIISLSPDTSEATVVCSQDLGSARGPEVTLVPASGIEVAVQVCDLCGDPGMEQRKALCRAPSNRSSACPEGQIVDWKAYDLNTTSKRITCKDRCHQHGFCKLHRMYEREKSDANSRPDLAIFFHPAGQYTPGANVCSSSCSYVCSADTSLAGVPVLDISEDARFSIVDSPIFKPSMGVAVHMVEHQLVSSGSVAKPLDLHAFLALDSASLNRHIAFLTHSRANVLRRMLPSFSDLRRRAMSSLRYLRASDTSAPALSAFACLGSLLFVYIIAQLMQGLHLTPSPQPSNVAVNVLTDGPGENALGPRMPRTWPQIMTSTEMGLTIATEIPVLAPRKPLRQESRELEEVVMTLPKELATMRYPPKVFASATQEGKDIKVSIVKINGSAIKVDLEPPYSDYPVEVMVWTESKPRFKRALTCNVKQNSLEKWSVSTLTASLLGTDVAQRVSSAISEMEFVWIASEWWLRHVLEELQRLATVARNQSLRVSQVASGLLESYASQRRKRHLERADAGKDGSCVRRVLANSRRTPIPAAEFQCLLLRRARDVSATWDASRRQVQASYVTLARNTKTTYRALQERSRSSLEVWQSSSIANMESWKNTLKAMRDFNARKLHDRVVKLADKAKRRADKVRIKAGKRGQRRSRRRS